MGLPSETRWFATLTATAFLLLAGIYLLYWNHVEYFVDDWFLAQKYSDAAAAGPGGVARFALSAIQNKVYEKFRLHWLGILYGFAVTWLGGYSARFNYAAVLLIHAACAWLFCVALARLGVHRGLAFLAGALYLLAPSTHFALFTNLANPFFVLGTFWILLMLWFFARAFAGKTWNAWTGVALCAAAVAGLFSGEQSFLLLWAILPLAVLCFGQDRVHHRAAAAIGATWAALGIAGLVFLLFINRVPVRSTGLNWRYQWTWEQFQNNLLLTYTELRKMSGFTSDALFRVSAQGSDFLLALGMAALVAAPIWFLSDRALAAAPSMRIGIFAVASAALAYFPVLWIGGSYSRFRYHYAPSPFLALGAAALCWVPARRPWLRLVPALLGGVVSGFFTLNAAAEIRQCWIPQSQHQRALEAALRKLQNVAPGDIVVVSGTPYEIGTAQHFSMHSSVIANAFAERATGVRPLQVGFDLAVHTGHLALLQRDAAPAVSEHDMGKTHVLVSSPGAVFSRPDWIAVPAHGDKLRLMPLKGAPPAPTGDFTREQLAFQSDRIYFTKTS